VPALGVPGDVIGCSPSLGARAKSVAVAAFSHAYAQTNVEQLRCELRALCDQADLDACHQLGLLLMFGPKEVRNRVEAARVFRAACDKGSAGGCVNALGLLLEADPPQEDDVASLRDRCVALCNQGIAKACSNAGKAYSAGSDVAHAIPLFQRACDSSEGPGCAGLARLYRHGSGVPRDEVLAARLNTRGCDLGDPASCNNLGDQYETGAGVSADLDRAIALYERSCTPLYPFGCFSLGQLYANQPRVLNPAKAATYYEKACGWGEPQSCLALGHMFATGNGVATDRDRARALIRAACTGGYRPACSEAGGAQ
jgi:TPR repeat protein